jgi:hypothetical protein
VFIAGDDPPGEVAVRKPWRRMQQARITVSSITFHKHQTGGCLSSNGVHLQEGKLNTGLRPLRIDLDGQ